MAGEDSPSTSKSAEKFVVRLPPGMRRRIADAARCYRRSMNSEIVARLEQSLDSGAAAFPVEAAADLDGVVKDSPEGAPQDPSRIDSTAQEIRLLEAFRSLPPERRRALLALLD